MYEKLFKQIYSLHIKQLKNLGIPHDKLLICFSGIPGSGKTHLAKIIEEKYKGVRINQDEIRKVIAKMLKLDDEKLDVKEDLNKILYGYLNWFYHHYKAKNNFIILDSGIDRRYLHILPLFKKEDYKIFIIRLKVSKRKVKERVIKKLGALDENYIANIKRWRKEWKEFGKKVRADIIIKYKDNVNLHKLFLKLDKFILIYKIPSK